MDISINTIFTLYRCLSAYCRDKNFSDFTVDDRIAKYIYSRPQSRHAWIKMPSPS